jgi:hypothetical protein
MATYIFGADHLGQVQDKLLDHKVCQEQPDQQVRLVSQLLFKARTQTTQRLSLELADPLEQSGMVG